MPPTQWRRRLPRTFTAPKVCEQQNEDYYSCFENGVFAISDGASISYDSASWSAILATRFVRNPRFSVDWLSEAIAEFAARYDRDSLPWMEQAAFDRGSCASLLGVELLADGEHVQVLSVGDSLAVLCDEDRIVSTFPYHSADEFHKDPLLLSTNRAENTILHLDDLTESSTIWNLAEFEHAALICMTDALGQWLLANRSKYPSPVSTLREIISQQAFNRFVETERAAGRLKRDDTTLLAMWGRDGISPNH